MTHHVTAMIVQAEAARHLTAAPERLDEALAAVGDTGRSAVADLRDLLDLLDPVHGTSTGVPLPVGSSGAGASPLEPAPVGSAVEARPAAPLAVGSPVEARPTVPLPVGLAGEGVGTWSLPVRQAGEDDGAGSLPVEQAGDLRALVEQTRRAGQPVRFEEEGRREGGPVAGAVTYRVVQEGLTNALKHAHGRQTLVRVAHGPEEITVEVTTGGAGRAVVPAGVAIGGSGRGLAGLRQRVEQLGGELTAGEGPGGGFVVRARIPGERHG